MVISLLRKEEVNYLVDRGDIRPQTMRPICVKKHGYAQRFPLNQIRTFRGAHALSLSLSLSQRKRRQPRITVGLTAFLLTQ